MSYESIVNKKFLDSAGTSHLWDKIRERYDSKLDDVVASNASLTVANHNQIAVVISAEADNLLQLKTSGNTGLYVSSSGAAGSPDTYSVVKDTTDTTYSAVYKLMKYIGGQGVGTQVGVDITIPKDMVVQSGQVVTKTAPQQGDPWPAAGTYIELTLANATSDKLYIPVDSLIEYVTSGSQSGDMVVISIDNNHQVTATISDNSITSSKLSSAVRDLLSSAATAVQNITEGSTNGTISVDGTDVSVHGLGTAAYTNSTAYDAYGSAAGVLGVDTDTASTATVYGVKKYASDVYAAIIPLTNNEIDAAIASANESLDNNP